MPELPVMKALAERLTSSLRGARLSAVQPLQFAALKTVAPAPDELRDAEVTGITSRGKYLLITFERGRIVLHLSQAGRVTVEDPPKRTRPRNGVVRFTFDRPPSLLVIEYGTERKAGWWVLDPDDEGPLAELGPEPHEDGFAELVRGGDDGRRLHTMLRDQRTVAGIGRGHADDILHRAQLSPFTSLARLDADERDGLLRSVREVLDDGLEAERRREGGLPPKLGDHWAVHARHGEPCPRCGETLRRVSYGSYEITYCAKCQTGGRVLADRRLSRLLK